MAVVLGLDQCVVLDNHLRETYGNVEPRSVLNCVARAVYADVAHTVTI